MAARVAGDAATEQTGTAHRSVPAATVAEDGLGMKTPKERAEERRREQLSLIDAQIASGDLTVRRMTSEERAKYPPRAQPKRGAGRKT